MTDGENKLPEKGQEKTDTEPLSPGPGEEERAEGAAAVPQGPADAGAVAAVDAAPAGRRNRLLVPLVIVSVLAALLLATTITLAVVGDFGGHDRKGAYQQGGRAPGMGLPPRAQDRPFNREVPDRPKDRPKNRRFQGNGDEQEQPEEGGQQNPPTPEGPGGT
jgi:hypothetical protein